MLIQRLGFWLGRVLFSLGALGVLAFVVLPMEEVGPVPTFDASVIGEDLDAHLAAAESGFDDLVPGTERRIVWASAPGVRTEFAVVYLHGFSASSEEIRPVPDLLAEALGANLHFMRYAGHGRSARAMAEPRGGDWLLETAEALEIARRIGDKVIVLSTSTGGALATLSLSDPAQSEGVVGAVFISPNFSLRNRSADWALHLPGVRQWGPWLLGAEQGFTPMNAEQAQFWTERYPTVSALPMGAVKRAARSADHAAISVPALFLISEADEVVSPEATREVAADWGGPHRLEVIEVPPGNDPYSHVLAGDILSPDLTGPVTDLILDWVSEL